jgi:hypothetical protein
VFNLNINLNLISNLAKRRNVGHQLKKRPEKLKIY